MAPIFLTTPFRCFEIEGEKFSWTLRYDFVALMIIILKQNKSNEKKLKHPYKIFRYYPFISRALRNGFLLFPLNDILLSSKNAYLNYTTMYSINFVGLMS